MKHPEISDGARCCYATIRALNDAQLAVGHLHYADDWTDGGLLLAINASCANDTDQLGTDAHVESLIVRLRLLAAAVALETAANDAAANGGLH